MTGLFDVVESTAAFSVARGWLVSSFPRSAFSSCSILRASNLASVAFLFLVAIYRANAQRKGSWRASRSLPLTRQGRVPPVYFVIALAHFALECIFFSRTSCLAQPKPGLLSIGIWAAWR